MTSVRLSILVFLVLAASGCTGAYRVVQLPQREADLYPLSQTKAGVTIAVDEIRTPDRAERYFGANLIRQGILPVAVIVSNYGEHRVAVKPSDILLQRGRDIVDPLPIEMVTAMAKEQHWFLRSRTQRQVESYFEGLAFRETVLAPNESYQGVMFFPVPRPERHAHTFFTILSLFREGGARVRVGVTDLDRRGRLHFGPFTLAEPELPRG